MLFGKAVNIENCLSWSKLMIMLHMNSRGTTFEYQRVPDWTTFSFCLLTVNQEKNTSRSPGRPTKNIFSVALGQMLVASGNQAPLEYSLVLHDSFYNSLTSAYSSKWGVHAYMPGKRLPLSQFKGGREEPTCQASKLRHWWYSQNHQPLWW